MSQTLRVTFLLAVVSVVLLAPAHAQVKVQTGTPPFGSFAGGPDIINLGNLNAHLAIPVIHKPGRGRAFSYDLSYDSSVWYPVTSGSTTTWQPVLNFGWRGITEIATGYISYNTWTGQCYDDAHILRNFTVRDTWIYHDPFGTGHEFDNVILVLDSYGCSGLTTVTSDTAEDGSGYSISNATNTSATLYSSDGKSILVPINSTNGTSSFTDRNGNKVTTDGSGHFYDTLSSTSAVLTVSGSGTSTSPMVFQYTAPSGSSVSYQMSYTNYTVATNFGFSTIGEYKSSAAVPLVSSIQLADGSQYAFTYEATPGTCSPYPSTTCVTARVKVITLPTGGSITYNYTGGNSGIFSDGSAAGFTRQTQDGTWTYTRSQISGSHWQTKATSPIGDDTVIDFQKDTGANFYETQGVTYQGSSSSGTVLQTLTTCYNGNATNCTATAVTAPITQQNVSPALPITNSTTIKGLHISTYNSYGVPTGTADYAFGSGTWGGIVRNSSITYAPLANIKAFRQQTTVQTGGGATVAQSTYSYDQTTPTPAPSGTPQLTSVSSSRGNLTSIQRCTNTSSCSSSYVQTTMTYDTAGQLQTITDPLQNKATLGYGDNFFVDSGSAPSNPPATYSSSVPTDAYVTSFSLPVGGSLSYGYYYYSGQLAVSSDPNGNSGYNHFQDSLSRLTSTFGPLIGGNRPWALNVYASSDKQVDSYTGITDTAPSVSCSSCRHDQTVLDGLGRNIHSYLVSDPEGETIVDTAYDADSRVQTVSHPFRSTSDATYGLETPTYDALGRVIKLTHPDGTYVQTFYGSAIGTSGLTTQSCSTSTYGVGYPVLVIDESGRKRQTWADALGRTIEGDEPDSSGNLTSYTCYSYDTLGNLLQIIHGSQTRSYVYDPLSRVTSVTIPERANSSGSPCPVTYTYDNNSNIKTRVAPAPNQTSCTAQVTTTYSYDGLNRLTKISYSDGTTPTVQYGYDGAALSGCTTTPPSLTDPNPKGRRTSMCDGSGATSWAHDATGRIITEKRIINSIPNAVTQTISYAYNLDSTIGTVTYPSGKTVTYTTSNAERLTSAKDTSSSTQFAVVASYAPTGALQGMITGQVSGGFGGVTESHTYNNSLEYTSTQATSSVNTALNLSLNYNLSGGDNGTVTSITNNIDNGRTQTLGYDPLNRISSMSSQATSGVDCWGQTFAPDSLGNLDSITSTKCNSTMLNLGVDANNHINNSGFGYDAAGNMTQDGTSGVTYFFDVENRMYKITGISGGPYCYFYDGNGLRVAKKSGANSDCTGGTLVKLYWRSISGDALAETDSTGSVTNAAYNEYVFFSGRQIAARNGTGPIFYYFADQVGSTRSITTGNGTGQTPGQLCYDADFTPYGLEIPHTEHLQTTACPPNYKFTGYERDGETGLDYAFARYYSSSLNRFYSTDPLGGSIGSLQSHNAYAYVTNNPANIIDPSGMDGCAAPKRIGADPCDGWITIPPMGQGLGLNPFDLIMLGAHSEEVPTGQWIVVGMADAQLVAIGGCGGLSDCSLTEVPVTETVNSYPGVGNFFGSTGSGGRGGNSSGSTTWLQTKVFFQALGRNFVDEFKPGGCVAAFAEGADKADFLGAIPPGQPIIEDAIKGTAATVAANYAATQALTVPLRSSVVRGILATGETAAAYVAPVYLLGLTVSGAIAEGKAIVNGTCH